MSKAVDIEAWMQHGGSGTDREIADIFHTSHHGVRAFIAAINDRHGYKVIQKRFVSGKKKREYFWAGKKPTKSLTNRFVVTTAQIVTRKYYVEVEDPTWAHDGIVMNELSEFSQNFLSEDIVDTLEVSEWPKATQYESVNAAQMSFDYETEEWQQNVRWDLS